MSASIPVVRVGGKKRHGIAALERSAVERDTDGTGPVITRSASQLLVRDSRLEDATSS
ncbi:hypothetical protein [Natrarchaeobaculum aegyptiacum]|uniref:hypothetical protein n=1 Tax=Natrarchaeobaculum aegyptiacum TaxID=745377 RepID=UPI0013747D1B|nr:hypothetical protein [Natrarchaeobaculum aegyptiacum]